MVADSYFAPASLTIDAGTTVTWTWAGDIPHDVTSGGGFSSDPAGTKTSGSYSVTFTSPGTYAYHCSVHQSSRPPMAGTISVR